MFAVMKKELKSYLLTPVGYVFIGVFLFVFSVFFLPIFNAKSTNFEYLFYNVAVVLTFVSPVLTMGMFAAERRLGTDQLIFTSPKSITAIVLGKLLAAIIVVIITEICSMMFFGILCFFGEPSISKALVTLGGFLILSIAYLSFGMFISTITENQIIAFFVTVGVFLLLWFLPDVNESFQMFSLINMYYKFPEGLISISNLITFASFSLLFILLTIIVLQRRKSVK